MSQRCISVEEDLATLRAKSIADEAEMKNAKKAVLKKAVPPVIMVDVDPPLQQILLWPPSTRALSLQWTGPRAPSPPRIWTIMLLPIQKTSNIYWSIP